MQSPELENFPSESFDSYSNLAPSKPVLRVQTAPARASASSGDIRSSPVFQQIEKAVFFLSIFAPGSSSDFDLDSAESQQACLNFLRASERLQQLLGSRLSSRDYVSRFSKAYRILYKSEGVSYLTEILDSAQEGVPCLFVNGERFEFSQDVLERGSDLQRAFCELQETLRSAFVGLSGGSGSAEIFESVRASLETFDARWARYEELYVQELMAIEGEARRLIREAIELDTKLGEREKVKGTLQIGQSDPEFESLRARLARAIGRLNAVANVEGHGRDDLDAAVLAAAEQLLVEISASESEAVRRLAMNVKKTFADLREIFQRYAENIEVVDPQLRNNEDLVEALLDYERAWEKGRMYFLDKRRCDQLIFLSNVVEGLSERFPDFKEKLNCCDSEIFVLIPNVLVFKKIEDADHGICERFLPTLLSPSAPPALELAKLRASLSKLNLKFVRSKEMHRTLSRPRPLHPAGPSHGLKTLLFTSQRNDRPSDPKRLSPEFAALVERQILLGEESKNIEEFAHHEDREELQKCLCAISGLSMELQRTDPTEWNSFLDLAIKHQL